MEWLEISIYTTTGAVDALCGMLYQLGITGFEIETKEDFAEFLETSTPYWDYVDEDLMAEKQDCPTRVKIYLRDNLHGRETLALVNEGLARLKTADYGIDFGSLELKIENVNEEDWANNWKQYFKPFSVGKKILVKPTWETTENPENRIVLNIDPGMLFGTGTHQTTRLCMELLEQFVTDETMLLDLGCGSGILSILGLLLGAKDAVAVDIDPNAVPIAYTNAAENGIDKSNYHVYAGNIVSDEAVQDTIGYDKYDIVVSNIVADVIIGISPLVPRQMKQDGVWIASGVIYDRLDEVKEAILANGFVIETIAVADDWAAIVSKRGK